MTEKKQNQTKSKLFTTPEERLVFNRISSPTSQRYVDDRKADMHKLQRGIDGYSEAYFSLSKHHV